MNHSVCRTFGSGDTAEFIRFSHKTQNETQKMNTLQEIFSNITEERIIRLGKEIYQLDKPLLLTEEHSNLIIRAEEGEKVVIDGGNAVTDWEIHDAEFIVDNGRRTSGKIWHASLTDGAEFLYRAGNVVNRARYPQEGTLHSSKWTNSGVEYTLPPEICKVAGDAELVLYFGWTNARVRPNVINENGFQFKNVEGIRRVDEVDFIIENMPAEFLAPGQWAVDKAEKCLYYRPLENEKTGDAEFFTSSVNELMFAEGCRNITFENIVFRHTGDARLLNSVQAAFRASAALNFKNCVGIAFRNCSFEQFSCWGAKLGDGCCGFEFSNCNFREMGAGAINMSGGKINESAASFNGYNNVKNCRIEHGGFRWAGAIGILMRHSAHNTIDSNEIAFFPYSGISCGWEWGYQPSVSCYNRIIGNIIHDLGIGGLVHDMGAIYMLGRQPGSVIAGNHIYNIHGPFFCWGIYLDEGSSDILVENNLVHDCSSEPFRVHFGKHNIVRNNVFIASRGGACCTTTRGTMIMHPPYSFERKDWVFNLTGNLCIGNGFPIFMKYLIEIIGKEEMLDCWRGDYNVLWQLDPSCKDLYADDYHYIKKTYTSIPAEMFVTCDRETHSGYGEGKLPSVETLEKFGILKQEVITLYKRYLAHVRCR